MSIESTQGALVRFCSERFRYPYRLWRLICSPDSKILAGSTDIGILLWDALSGELLPQFSSGDKPRGFYFSVDSKAIAATAADNTLRDLISGAPIEAPPSAPEYRVVLDSSLRVYLGEELLFSHSQSNIRYGVLSPDKSSLLVVYQKGRKEKAGDPGDYFKVFSIPEGALVYSIDPLGRTEVIKSYEHVSGGEVEYTEQEPIHVLGWAFSGSFLALVSDDRKIRLWDLNTKALLATLTLENFEGDRESCHLCFSPDLRWIAFASKNNALRVWSTQDFSCRPLQGANTHPSAIVFSSDSKILFAASTQLILRWELASHKLLEDVLDDKFYLRSLALSAKHQMFASATANIGSIKLWDTKTGAFLRACSIETLEGQSDLYNSQLRFQEVENLCLSQNGEFLYASNPREVFCWAASTGKLCWRKLVEPYTILGLSLSPDSARLIVAEREYHTYKECPSYARLYDAVTGKLLREYESPRSDGIAVALSSKYTALLHRGGDLSLWDESTRKLRIITPPTAKQKNKDASLIAFSADGEKLAVGDQERILIFSCATGELLYQYDFETEVRVVALAFTEAGELRALVGVSQAQAPILLWSQGEQRELFRCRGTLFPYLVGAFSEGASQVAFSTPQQTMLLFDASPKR
jgi:WD40 repeat protein